MAHKQSTISETALVNTCPAKQCNDQRNSSTISETTYLLIETTSTGRTRASAIASARSRRGPSTTSRASAQRVLSDAPATSPPQTSGAWPRCPRPTTVSQTRSVRGHLCDRHHSRTTSSESRRSRASESHSPASSLSSTTNSSPMPLRPTKPSTPSATTYEHRSALRGTPGNAQCPASRSQVTKPKPQELPACVAACGWRGFASAL